MIFIVNEGALFRGPSRPWPTEVWSQRQRRWLPYHGRTPKPIEWGDEVDEAEAQQIMDESTAEADGASRFLAFPAKRLIVLRVDGDGAAFWNPRLKTWQLWRRPIPSTALPIPKAEVWQLIRYDYAGYDFGTLRPRWRESPTGSDC